MVIKAVEALLRPFIRHVVCIKSVLNPYASCSVNEMYHDLSMFVFCFRGHTFVDNFIYELQKSTTIAFSRTSLYTFYSINPICEIHQCLRISNRKYPPMPSEFHNREPPLPFGNPKSRPWYGMDIFWNRPLKIIPIIKNWTIASYCNFRHLIGLVVMVYEPLYHAQETAAIQLSSGCPCRVKSADLAIFLNCF